MTGSPFFLPSVLTIHSISRRHSAVYDLLVDELDADPTLLNIRGETVRPGLTGLWLCEQRSKFSRPDGRLVNVVYLCQFRV